jgi:hypothetical protein
MPPRRPWPRLTGERENDDDHPHLDPSDQEGTMTVQSSIRAGTGCIMDPNGQPQP